MIDDDDARREPDDDEYLPDPDAAPTAEGRERQALDEVHKLLGAAAMASAAMFVLIAVLETWSGRGYGASFGFLLGAGLSALNVWLLARGVAGALRGDRVNVRAIAVVIGGFVMLLVFTLYVVLAHRGWTIGFALGLATPALAGLLYARRLSTHAR